MLFASTQARRGWIIKSNPDFPPRRVVRGISTPVWIWSEVKEWAKSRPEEFK